MIAKQFDFKEDLIVPVNSDEINFEAKRPKNTSLISDKISSLIEVNMHSIEYVMKVVDQVYE